MKYLITVPPRLLSIGTYSFEQMARDEALHWFKQHHKELKISNIGPNAAITNSAPNMQIVQLLAEAVDCYIGTKVESLNSIDPHDEVLVVLPEPKSGPQIGGQRQLTIDGLQFFLFTMSLAHQTHHSKEHAHSTSV